MFGFGTTETVVGVLIILSLVLVVYVTKTAK